MAKKLAKSLIFLALLVGWATGAQAQLGGPPTIAVQPLGLAVQNGGTALITSTALSLTSMSFTWYFNGKKIDDPHVANVAIPLVGTVSTLTLSNVQSGASGNYSVYVKNSSGTVISSNATLVVVSSIVSNVVSTVTNTVGFVSSALKMTTSGLQLQLSVPVGSNIVIHASSDLTHWTPISTNSSSTGTLTFTDTNALHVTSRFYRAMIQ